MSYKNTRKQDDIQRDALLYEQLMFSTHERFLNNSYDKK